jgi:molybdopterin converting factor subunit 1
VPQVQLRFFASLRERLGPGETRTVTAGTTAGLLWQSLSEAHPSVARVRVRYAVNERYVEPDHVLADGDEIAFFPPVSGG